MAFTKPRKPVKPTNMKVLLVGDKILVLNTDEYMVNDEIGCELKDDGWTLARYDGPEGLGYSVSGFTQADRDILRDELFQEYLDNPTIAIRSIFSKD